MTSSDALHELPALRSRRRDGTNPLCLVRRLAAGMRALRGVKLVPQRKDWDCGIAALAMLLDMPYGNVSAAVRAVVTTPRLKARGLVVKEAEAVAAYLGHPLKRIYRRQDYLVGQVGMLGLLGDNLHRAGHWVVLKDLQILEPDGGEVWNVDDYMKKYKARPCTLLVRANA